MTVKLLTEYHLEFLSLTGGCTRSSESTQVKMPHSWKSHVSAHMYLPFSPFFPVPPDMQHAKKQHILLKPFTTKQQVSKRNMIIQK